MELEYTDRNRRRSKVYIAVGVIIALLVGGVVFVALRFSGITEQQAVETREIVVAAVEIPARKPIEEGDLAMRTVPVDPTNEAAFTRIDEVLGRVSGVYIEPGQIVSKNLLASTTEGQEFSILEPGTKFDPAGPDLRAVSVSVADDRAVAGTLQPGQRVDLIVTMVVNPLEAAGEGGAVAPPTGESDEAEQATPTEFIAGPTTKATLQALTILARNGSIYILRADLATAEKIAELTAAGGQFTLVLRADEDDRTAETEGSTLDQLVEEFGFPIPKPFEITEEQAAN